jgi:phosphoribosylamine--glycine ligase
LSDAGLRVFGPRAAAARLEGSKSFAKEVMAAAGVPTAASETFTDAEAACAYAAEQGAPIVVKADGLAAGKGVTVCATEKEARDAIAAVLQERAFGDAGSAVVVEECLVGEEASILALVGGEAMALLPTSQDHKPVFDGDRGPNTGGMGAYSPATVIAETDLPQIKDQILIPTVNELRRRGIDFCGVLYAGLMITADGPRVLEYNCRFGDPEAQAVIPRVGGSFVDLLDACIDGTIRQEDVVCLDDACVCVVMASGGYPGSYLKGKPIAGLAEAEADDRVVVFHAGTGTDKDGVVTAGGRVLGVSATGPDVDAAVETAYAAVAKIDFDEAHYRTDIAAKELKRSHGRK